MKENHAIGYLPDERPSNGKLLLFALQHILVMFPATVLVALLTGFHVSTTIFASGFATLCFLFITKGKIPLYYGSSFSYIAAIVGITGGSVGVIAADQAAMNLLISQAQFGIIASGFVSILAGLVVNRFGQAKIEKFLPATVTGSIAIIIGLSLAGTALTGSIGYDGTTMNMSHLWVALITVTATILFSVYLKKGIWGQLPILLGILVGYVVSIPFGVLNLQGIFDGELLRLPYFTLPKPNVAAVWAIMPIAIATIPESTAHLFQLDIYVNNLAKKKGKKQYDIGNRLGSNLIGDGVGDIVSAAVGGPAGTNYGENISTMAITNNFSVYVLGAAAIITMLISFISPLSALVASIPSPVINGAGVYLFGVIAAQGIAILINKGVDLFDARNLAIIAIILIIGLGGHFAFPNGMIPVGNASLPAIATASVFGIVFNIILNITTIFKK